MTVVIMMVTMMAKLMVTITARDFSQHPARA